MEIARNQKRIATKKGFIFSFSSEDEARQQFGCNIKEALAIVTEWNCPGAIIKIKGQSPLWLSLEAMQSMAEFEPLSTVFFANTALPSAVILAIAPLMAQESRWGIVEVTHTQRQVVMSSGMSGVLLAGVAINQTTNWRRPEFWHPEDLATFERDWRRQLDIEGNQAIEARYRIRKPGSSDPWRYYCSSYRLLQGEDGLLYQIGQFVGRD